MIILHLIHKILLWLFILAPIAIVLKLFQFTLGWLFIAPFVKSDGNLPEPLKTLFQPDDSLAIGDDPKVSPWLYQDKEGAFTKSYPQWLRNYVLAVLWGARNPAYGFDALVGINKNIEIVYSKGQHIDFGEGNNLGGRVIVTKTGHWNLIYAFAIPKTNRGFLISLGWNLQGEVNFSSIRNMKIDIGGKAVK